METEERVSDVAEKEARDFASNIVVNCKYSVSNYVCCDIPYVFGWGWREIFDDKKTYLSCMFREEFRNLIFLSVRYLSYVIHYYDFFDNKSSEQLRILYPNGMPDRVITGQIDEISNSDTELIHYGYAEILHHELWCKNKPEILLSDTHFFEYPHDYDIFNAISLVWFLDASAIFPRDSRRALNILADSTMASEYAIAAETREDGELSIAHFHSKNGKKGAEARNAPIEKLKKWVVDESKKREWPSANAAAYDLTKEVLEKSRLYGANLKPSNAQRTIAEWIRKAKKSV